MVHRLIRKGTEGSQQSIRLMCSLALLILHTILPVYLTQCLTHIWCLTHACQIKKYELENEGTVGLLRVLDGKLPIYDSY